ncbi:MAG TPA: hypothetical protein VEC99_13300 [Clostridia bacterium]|nr:hypothetical protein [Clostridia bacterium]
MLTRSQQILLKRAQKEAGLSDAEYREAIEVVTGIPGCRSSKEPSLTDRHLDKMLAYFEAIHWRRVDLNELPAECKPGAVFRQRGFWAGKNTNSETSRDRFVSSTLGAEISRLERALGSLGFGVGYCQAIRERVCGEDSSSAADYRYKAALERTLSAKRKSFAGR